MPHLQATRPRYSAWLALALLALLAGSQTASAQFVTGDEEQVLRAMIPLEEFKDDPRVLIYTERTMPKTYQLEAFNGGVLSVHDVNHNISADPGEAAKGHGRGGNIRVEFPWRHTAGTDRCPTVRNFKFLRLPPGKPVVWFQQRYPQPEAFSGGQIIRRSAGPVGYGWVFPTGTVVGEVITQRNREGYDFTFEVRTRERLDREWVTDLFRPFRNHAELSAAIKQARPEWEKEPQLVALVKHLDTPAALPRKRLADGNHTVARAFDVTASVDELPPMDEDLAAALLASTPFKSCMGETWRNQDCYAPTTRAAFHIVPTNYDGSFVGSDDVSCKKCHESSGKHVSEFQSRDWYGFMSACDQVISFHPFDPSCIIQDAGAGPVRMRNIPGVIERYDPAKHSEGYHALAE
jgi:hypothetical protein